MTLVDHSALDPGEALIREARERQRRRRRRAAGGAAIAALLAAAGYAASTRGGDAHTPTPPPRPAPAARPLPATSVRPVVDLAALHGQGSLAFVSHGALWLADARTGTVHLLLPASDIPQRPSFSADGRWLLVNGTVHGHLRIWLARANGTDLHRLGLLGADLIGWAPHGNRLAVAVAGPNVATSTLEVVTPPLRTARIGRVNGFGGGAWSPNGRAIAVASDPRAPGRTTLATYSVSGGHPRIWFSLDSRRGRLDGMNEIRLVPVGWWRHQGIGFWVFGDGAVFSPDQAPLDLLRGPGDAPVDLGNVPTSNEAAPIATTRAGNLAVVSQVGSSGFGRLIWQGKHVTICPSDGANCTPLREPRHTVTLDPTWSSDGHTLAYVQAPRLTTPGFPNRRVRRWYAAHQLEIYDATTGSRRTVRGARGVAAPRWSRDGSTLLYAAADGLWTLKRGATQPMRVATPLFPRPWPTFYGEVDWIGQFAWSAAAN